MWHLCWEASTQKLRCHPAGGPKYAMWAWVYYMYNLSLGPHSNKERFRHTRKIPFSSFETARNQTPEKLCKRSKIINVHSTIKKISHTYASRSASLISPLLWTLHLQAHLQPLDLLWTNIWIIFPNVNLGQMQSGNDSMNWLNLDFNLHVIRGWESWDTNWFRYTVYHIFR